MSEPAESVRVWCCGTPVDGPHAVGCAFAPVGVIDYNGPAEVVQPGWRPPIYLGDGAYVEQGSWPGEACVFTSNGIARTNQIFLDVAMIDKLHAWVHRTS